MSTGHRREPLARALRHMGRMATLALALAVPAAAELPPEGRCPDYSGGAGGLPSADGGVPLLQEGTVLRQGDILRLRELLPGPIWSYRDTFFHEGMRMELGWCHRRYPVSEFYASATERFASRVKLDSKGNLKNYVAGLPFPPDQIDPSDEKAGLKWAWNFQHRYRGAGPSGSFRIVDMPSRIGQPETYKGNFFYLRTGHRSDLPASEYRVPDTRNSIWVAGGRFTDPFNARHLAWRQIRPEKTERRWEESDDTFVYVPTMRKPRRSATAWVDGLFMPRYTVSGDSGGGGVPFGAGGTGDGSFGGVPQLESINPTAGWSIAATEHRRTGLTGLAIRPNAYVWRYVGEREVLAPINASSDGYPEDEDRNFGPSGLSVASDRWDVRYAVIIEGVARRRTDELAAVQLWIDYQTQQPLFYISKRENGFLLDVGILVHRFSGDRLGYPEWPGGEQAQVFEPVAASFYYVPGGGAGWRRESYDVRSLPIDPGEVRRLTTTRDLLIRGR